VGKESNVDKVVESKRGGNPMKKTFLAVFAVILCSVSVKVSAQGQISAAARIKFTEDSQKDIRTWGVDYADDALSCQPDTGACTTFIWIHKKWTAQNLVNDPLASSQINSIHNEQFTSVVVGNGETFYTFTNVEGTRYVFTAEDWTISSGDHGLYNPTGPFKSVDDAMAWVGGQELVDGNPDSPTYGKALMHGLPMRNPSVIDGDLYKSLSAVVAWSSLNWDPQPRIPASAYATDDPPAETQPKPVTRVDFAEMFEHRAEAAARAANAAREELGEKLALQRIVSLGFHFFEPQPEVKAGLARFGYPLWTCIPANGRFDGHEARMSECVTQKDTHQMEMDFVVAEIVVDPDTQEARVTTLDELVQVTTDVSSDHTGVSVIHCSPANKFQRQITAATCH
jgi:hypothetical protein